MKSRMRVGSLLVLALFVVAVLLLAGEEGGDASDEMLELGDLPWREKQPLAPGAPTAPRSKTPQQMLALMGIERSQLESFFDHTPLSPDSDEALARLLFRLPQISLANIDRWERSVTGAELAESPGTYRGDFIHLEGTVTRVEQLQILPEIARLYEFGDYYRVHMQLHDSPHQAILATRVVPASWTSGEPLEQRASAAGLFLKVGERPEGAEAANLVFATQRIAWHPTTVQPELDVTASHVLLGGAGMDIGLLAPLKKLNRRGMGHQDRESFYQMLDAMQRLEMPALQAHAQRFDLAAMLTRPQDLHGKLFASNTVARRITRIGVSDSDIRQRFGIDHYFQIDCFVPLRDTTVRLGSKSDNKEDPVFTNHYPITFCTIEIPAALKKVSEKFNAGEIPTETLNERVRVVGFFWKLWAYQSEYVSQFGEKKQQWAPMLIGIRPERIEAAAWSRWWGVLGGAGFLVVLAAIWIGVYRFNRADERFEETKIKRQFELPEGESLNEMGLDAPRNPDFSNLDEK